MVAGHSGIDFHNRNFCKPPHEREHLEEKMQNTAKSAVWESRWKSWQRQNLAPRQTLHDDIIWQMRRNLTNTREALLSTLECSPVQSVSSMMFGFLTFSAWGPSTIAATAIMTDQLGKSSNS